MFFSIYAMFLLYVYTFTICSCHVVLKVYLLTYFSNCRPEIVSLRLSLGHTYYLWARDITSGPEIVSWARVTTSGPDLIISGPDIICFCSRWPPRVTVVMRQCPALLVYNLKYFSFIYSLHDGHQYSLTALLR